MLAVRDDDDDDDGDFFNSSEKLVEKQKFLVRKDNIN